MSPMNEEKFALSILVANESGVLTRVSGLFGRRGYNIDSLSVGETEDPAWSRITVVFTGDKPTQDQIIKQLQKLVDVKTVTLLDWENTVFRELMLVKVNAEMATRAQIHQIAEVFHAKVVDLSTSAMTMEITGEKSKLDAFINNLVPFGILALCRTGVTAIGRHSHSKKTTESEEDQKWQ